MFVIGKRPTLNVQRSTFKDQRLGIDNKSIRSPQSKIRNLECQGGELNSRPTPNVFGAAHFRR